MNTSRLHIAWASAGLAFALTVGSPVWADDTELLLSNPAASTASKPNILFILDSSGSMTSIEKSQEPFTPGKPYSGPCSIGRYYWTKNGTIPDCSTDEQYIEKQYFVCQQGIAQIATAGSYTDTMAQYRKRNMKWKWRSLKTTAENKDVECQGDSGQHGNGNPNERHARIGTNVSQFTNDPGQEVAWGSSPTQDIVTMYDGTYLNWYYNPPGTSMSRTDIVKTVTKNVLGSISDVNVGFMQFHSEEGGPVTRAVKDLDSSRSAAINTVDKLPASGWTPLSETLYESALYWRGQGAKYGQLNSTDYAGLDTSSPMNYKAPSEYSCSKNFTVLLTDGQPTRDRGAYPLTPKLPNFIQKLGRSSCTGGDIDGACLDDISEYLSKEDINPNLPGDQIVTTYTIGFTVDLPILKDTAEKSGGQYYLADDVKSLTAALTDIVTNIFDRDISFTAPAVAVNAFNRTQHLNDMYVSVFRATDRHHWPGNLKKYSISNTTISDMNGDPAVDPKTGFFADKAHSFWTPGTTPDGADVYSGGAANLLPDPISRRVFTNNGVSDLTANSNAVSVGNIGSFSLSDFGLTGAAGEPDLPTIIDWTRGVDVLDEDNEPKTFVRKTMGDTLHSQPASIVYDGGAGIKSAMDIVVFSATNDGYLHAVDARTGIELWSFIPNELLPNLSDLYFNNNVNFKNYGIDGDLVPVVIDRNKNGSIDVGSDTVMLIFGMRRGGVNYYALDVTDKNKPELKWLRNYAEFGQTWSAPVPAKIDINTAGQQSAEQAVLVMGAGYDTSHDKAAHPSTADGEGAGIFMLDLETGNELWRAGPGSGADLPLATMTRSIPTRVRVIDMDGDQYADRMYASDLGGQLWRFDINNGKDPANLVAGGVIAQLGAEGMGSASAADTRRFYTSPDVSLFYDAKHDKRYLALSIGSGYRAHPLDKSASDRFFSVRDPDVFTPITQPKYDVYPIIKDGDLKEVSGKFDVTLNPGDAGWKFSLPPGEKVLSDSATFDDSVYFVSFEPQVSSADPCQAGLSINRLYRVSVLNGDPVVDTSALDPNDPPSIDSARVTELGQGGIAPKPQFLFPSPMDPTCKGLECAPPPVGCVGVECFDPGFPNNPVRTLWVQDGVE